MLGGFIDLANLVSGDGAAKKLNAFEELAYKMGGEVYVDINGWHLYVKGKPSVVLPPSRA